MEKQEERRKIYEKKIEESKKTSEQNDSEFKSLVATNYTGATCYLRRISKNFMNELERNNLLASIRLNAPRIIFDMGYEEVHGKNPALIKSLERQIVLSLAENQSSKEPFQIHFCNLNYDGLFFKNTLSLGSNSLVFDTSKSYMDVFKSEELIYLTPNSKNVMKEFNPDKVYIIGALIDKCPSFKDTKLATYSQAKRHRISTARFPLDLFLNWRTCQKNLNIDVAFKILLKLYETNGDWKAAFKHSIRKFVYRDFK